MVFFHEFRMLGKRAAMTSGPARNIRADIGVILLLTSM